MELPHDFLMVKQFTTKLPNMKTYYDITLITASGDNIKMKGVSYSLIAQLSYQFDSVKEVVINKEYSKKISKY
jgi:mRNA-degrading endonuclease HigB of HigAB toxin-antitoxin module